MTLIVGLLDLIKFDKLRDSNAYLQEVIRIGHGELIITTDDVSEIERLLIKNNIRYRIKGRRPKG